MASSLFPLLKIPDFQEIQLSEKKFISSKFLFEGPKSLFKKVFNNFLSDENQKKNFVSRSAFTQFVKEFCSGNKIPNPLAAAKNEWIAMDDEQKDDYRTKEVTLSSCKPKVLKIKRKCRLIRCSYSIFIQVKCKEKSRSYEELGNKWKSLPEEKKIPYHKLYLADKERAGFEKSVFNRFELVLRLLGAASSNKLVRKYNGYIVFRDELKASLIERGFNKIPNLDAIGRRRYIKLDKEARKNYKSAAVVKNTELVEQFFEKVYKKANVDYGELIVTENVQSNWNNLLEEDFDEFLNEETHFKF